MDRVSSTQVRHAAAGLADVARWVRDWEVWSLPGRVRAYVLAVICADLALVAVCAATFRPHAGNLALFAALLACVAATVELTRRAYEPTGVVKDVYAVWELPVVIMLPPLYALAMPAIRLALTQWRIRKAPAYRRVFTAAAIGLAYGSASAVYHAVLPGGSAPRSYLPAHAAIWLLAAIACAITQWAVNQALILTAVKATEPETRIREAMFGQDAVRNDVTELCAALLVALGLTVSPWMLIIAFPLTTMLQRAFRHDQLLHQARADAKTGLLNAATWERHAEAEVARAVRTRSPLAVAVLDLDKFKDINDTYGHLLGDQVLRGIAGTLTEVLREYDLAGRFGGEEFVMMLPQTRAVDALRIAERVRAHIARLGVYADGPSGPERVPVTVSIGVAALDAGTSRELTELLAAADAALYRAKASGRDQVQMISTSRGLSAVRPPAPAAPSAPGPPASAGSAPPASAASPPAAGADGASAPAPVPAESPADAGSAKAQGPNAQLPDEDSSTTATTSALAV